jgi:hypothetical protein
MSEHDLKDLWISKMKIGKVIEKSNPVNPEIEKIMFAP